MMQMWTSKNTEFFSSITLTTKMSCADILHDSNGNFKEAYLKRHREIKFTCRKVNSCFDIVMLINKNIASLHVEQSVFG
jgi:hypothetical protein